MIYVVLSGRANEVHFKISYCIFNKLYWWYLFQRDNKAVRKYRTRYGRKSNLARWTWALLLSYMGLIIPQEAGKRLRSWAKLSMDFEQRFQQLIGLIDKILNFKQQISKCAMNTRSINTINNLLLGTLWQKKHHQKKSLKQPEAGERLVTCKREAIRLAGNFSAVTAGATTWWNNFKVLKR